MLLDIPDTTPLKHIFEFAQSQGCCSRSNLTGGFDFVPLKNSFNLNAAKKIQANAVNTEIARHESTNI